MKETTDTYSRWTLLAAAAATLGVVGCGPVGGGSVDHETSQKHLERSSGTMSERLTDSTVFLEDSELFNHGYGTAYDSPDIACTAPEEDGSGTGDDTNCETEETEPELRFAQHIEEYTDRVVSELQERVFKQDNIVQESNTSITYAVEGEDVCEETYESCTYDTDGNKQECEEQPNDYYDECKSQVDAMEYRIRVTRPEATVYKYTVQVAPEQYEPVSFSVGDTSLAVTASLGDIKSSIEHSDDVYDSNVASELPSTMQGRVRAALSSDGPKHSHFEIKIESAIDISGNDYDVALAQAAKPVFGLTADGEAETLTSTLNFNQIQASWPTTHYKSEEPVPSEPESDSDSEPDEPESKTLQYALNLAGATVKSKFEAGSETFEFSNIGVGDSTSWLKIDGKKAVTVDLNPNDGRSFGVDIGIDRNNDGTVESFTADVEPAFDLTTDFDFTHVSEWLYVDDYMENYTFEALLDGAQPASLLANDDHLKVTAGQLALSSENPSAGLTVGTGQCLDVVDTEPSTCSSGDDSCDSGDSEPYHPLRDFEVTDCQ